MSKRVRLTNQEELFCQYYLTCFNASQAVQLAGYDTNLPAQLGYQLKNKTHISKRIKKLQSLTQDIIIATKQDVIRCVQDIAFDDGNCIRDRLKALDLLCKISGYNAPAELEVSSKQIVFNETVYINKDKKGGVIEDKESVLDAEIIPTTILISNTPDNDE